MVGTILGIGETLWIRIDINPCAWESFLSHERDIITWYIIKPPYIFFPKYGAFYKFVKFDEFQNVLCFRNYMA